MVAQARNPTFQGVEAGELEFKVILGYIVSSGDQPGLRRDPISNIKTESRSPNVLAMCHQIHHPRAVLMAQCRRQGFAQG